MKNNRIDITIPAETLAAADAAITGIEGALNFLQTLEKPQRRALSKMGYKSAEVARTLIELGKNNAGLLPRDLDIAEVERDVAARDLLRSRLDRVEALCEKIYDTTLLLNADMISGALIIYHALKRNGSDGGLKSKLDEIGRYFSRTGKDGGTTPGSGSAGSGSPSGAA